MSRIGSSSLYEVIRDKNNLGHKFLGHLPSGVWMIE